MRVAQGQVPGTFLLPPAVSELVANADELLNDSVVQIVGQPPAFLLAFLLDI